MNGWDPEFVRDEVRLRETSDPVEAFEIFVKRHVNPSLHAHFADTDENDAQFVRDAIERAVERRVKVGPLKKRNPRAYTDADHEVWVDSGEFEAER